MLYQLLLIISISCGSVYCNYTAPRVSKQQHIELQRRLDSILKEASSQAHIGIEVVSLTNGLRLYEREARRLFIPASSLKLFTAIAGLSLLGPDFRFETRLSTDGHLEKRTLKGNLYFIGGGDPELSLRDLDSLILQLQLSEIEEIQGDLILDSSAFDQPAKGPGWMWDDINSLSFSTVSALTINHSCLNIWIKPAEQLHQPARLFSFPESFQLPVTNQVETTGDSVALTVERPLTAKELTFLVKGSIPLGEALQTYSLPLDQPALYTGKAFEKNLQQAGINLKGKIRLGKAPKENRELAHVHSRPLSMLIQTLLKYSDNLYSDHLLKKIGHQASQQPGSWENGREAIHSFLRKEVGLDAEELVILDGSGLSRYNLVSPHQFVQLLSWIYLKSPYAAELIAALPIAGGEGTLRNRMPSIGKHLRAKTGSLQGITNLCGYLTTKSGEKLAFAILINGFINAQRKDYELLANKICECLADL